jgi:hypothetical protein
MKGMEIPQGKDFRYGYLQTLENTGLIVWFKAESQSVFKICPERKKGQNAAGSLMTHIVFMLIFQN